MKVAHVVVAALAAAFANAAGAHAAALNPDAQAAVEEVPGGERGSVRGNDRAMPTTLAAEDNLQRRQSRILQRKNVFRRQIQQARRACRNLCHLDAKRACNSGEKVCRQTCQANRAVDKLTRRTCKVACRDNEKICKEALRPCRQGCNQVARDALVVAAPNRNSPADTPVIDAATPAIDAAMPAIDANAATAIDAAI